MEGKYGRKAIFGMRIFSSGATVMCYQQGMT
jgi:hypothetical protein